MSYIVVVEDEHTAALEIQMSLEEAGHSVPKVFSSGEGLISAFERGDWIQAPELLLIDLTPAGMLNGVETASRLEKLTNAPIIFLTSEHDQVLRNTAERLKPAGYITKPIERASLYQTVQNVLSQRHDTLWQEQAASSDILGDATIITDTDARITFINSVAERFLGVRNASVRGHLLRDIYTLRTYDTNRPVYLPIQKVLEQGQTIVDDSNLLIDVNGYELRIMERMIPLRNASDKIIGMHITFGLMNREENQRRGGMEGRIEEFDDTLAIIHSFTTFTNQGKMVFEQPEGEYSFYLEHGRVIHFEYPDENQTIALQKVSKLKQGNFRFHPNFVSHARTMNINPMYLLLEVSKKEDEDIKNGAYDFIQQTHKGLFMVSQVNQVQSYINEMNMDDIHVWLHPIPSQNLIEDEGHMLIVEDNHHRLVIPYADTRKLPQELQEKLSNASA